MARTHKLSETVTARVNAPVVVATSRPGEKRWGFYQFPTLSTLPGGDLLLMFSRQQDAVAGYGTRVPGYVSGDGGATWAERKDRGQLAVAPHGVVSEVFDDEFLCVPAVRALDTKKAGLKMPDPLATCRQINVVRRLADCPEPVRKFASQLDALRWTPKTEGWADETVAYDSDRAIVWSRKEGPEEHLIPRTWFERPLLRMGKELLYADYRQIYIEPDGHVPKNHGVSCMVSTDNGRTFKKRATVALDRTGKVLTGEPMLAPTSDGRLACVMRRQAGDAPQLMPMAIAFSKDKGRTWTKPAPLPHRGVFPTLVLLKNGVMVLAYGRPGVHLIFSLDGTGREWTAPLTLRPGDRKHWSAKTCGYTAIAPLGKDSFLVAYSDFEHRDADGRRRKAIVVRNVSVHKNEQAHGPDR